MASPSLPSLPPELVCFVIDHLDRFRDLSALARSDRKLYNITNPVIYKRAVSQGDAWPLAWAAHCGIAGTLTKILDAGVRPDFRFLDSLPLEDWKRVNAAARLAATVYNKPANWDHDDSCEPTAEWSPETEGSDHTGTGTTRQPSSNSSSEHWGWDQTVEDRTDLGSDVSMGETESRLSDDGPPLVLEPGHTYRTDSPSTVVRYYTALHLAVQNGHNDIVEILLDRGAPINPASSSLCECTHQPGLLNNAESPDADRDPPLWSPLHIAICHSRSETAKLLLSRGASHMMEHGDPAQSITALHHASAMGLSDVVRHLVENAIQTDIEVRDSKTLTPLYYAYAQRRWNSTLPLLLELGANINVDIKLFLPYSTITPLGEACRLGHFDTVDRLLDLGADAMRGYIATNSGRGLSPLHMCCMPSAKSADETPAGFGGSLARRQAEEEVDRARMKTIAKLISRGASLDAQDCSGDTPLIAAAQNHNVPALRAVIEAGADVNQCNVVGRNALMQAILGPQNPTTSTEDNPEPLTQTIRVLVDGGASLSERDAEGNTLLHLVFKRTDIWAGDQKFTLRFLLSIPGMVELISSKNKENLTPLQLAFQARNLEACDILIRRGCLRGGLGHSELLAMWVDAVSKPWDQDTLDFVLDLDVAGTLTLDPSALSTLSPFAQRNAAHVISKRYLSAPKLPIPLKK